MSARTGAAERNVGAQPTPHAPRPRPRPRDSRSPWAAIHEIASAQAPGTVAYLQVNERASNIEIGVMSDFGIATCDGAVTEIKQDVAAQTAAGAENVDDLSVDEGLALLGLYKAYIAQVREEVCPRDELGNDEFGFMGSH